MIAYREIFVAFHSSWGHQPRWYYFLRKRARFQHVSAFYYDLVYDAWNLIEWTEVGLFYGVVSNDELDAYVVAVCTNSGKILRFKAKQRDKQNMPFLGLGYCVAGAKHLTNIKSWAITPDQLFGALQRRGARAAFTSVGQDGDNANGCDI